MWRLGVGLLASVALAQPDFRASVWPVFLRAQCSQCHQDNGVASTTRLRFPNVNTEANIQAFGLSLRPFVNPARPDSSLLLEKPTNRVPHGGGERIRRGSAEEQALRLWVHHLASLPEQPVVALPDAAPAAKPVLRRLTHLQYNLTVKDLLGDETHPANAFPREDFINGFTNQAEGQSVSPLLAEAYARAAQRLAENAFGKGDRRGLIGCRPSNSCRDDFLRRMGLRTFRRPLRSDELERYRKLFAKETDFFRGAKLVTEAMLQSPHFLFHLEPGLWGLASRLSYFLWDTMPDDALFSAAQSGALADPKQLEAQVQRMLADPRAQQAFDRFLSEWLRFDRLRNALRDRNLYPEYSPELVENMIEETRRLFRHAAWGEVSFLEFFTAEYSFLNSALARLYGLEPPAEPWAKMALPALHPRAGILGHASFLTLTSKPVETSPTERGLFIREHFLCQVVPPPPAGVNTALPPVTEEKPISQRERLRIHLADPVCASCHSLVDPIGFGLENFDAIGRYRETERILVFPAKSGLAGSPNPRPSEHHLPIHAEGFLLGIADARFRSPRELGRILAHEPACQKCIVKQVFRYAMGRLEGPEDEPLLETIFQRFRDSHFRFPELIMSLAKSSAFQAGL
ncbi:MAG: DUF1592 domain-containing protein [Bryobacteraceae bacterium]|nr:DUF1592 domain-containing protein [Bryobacteraceae bacterium]MDW8377691.1 DUF1592 domain-containing protein [Bryobacterales bacterium]